MACDNMLYSLKNSERIAKCILLFWIDPKSGLYHAKKYEILYFFSYKVNDEKIIIVE